MLRCIVIGCVIGAGGEFAARKLDLWVYRAPRYPILNVIVVFGIIMGGVASMLPALGVLLSCTIAFAIGLGYEVVNLRLLRWWYFPGERLLFIHGHAGIVVALGALWGLVPAMIACVEGVLK